MICLRIKRTKFECRQTVIEKTIRMKEADTSKTETLRDTSRVVRHLHLASTLPFGS